MRRQYARSRVHVICIPKSGASGATATTPRRAARWQRRRRFIFTRRQKRGRDAAVEYEVEVRGFTTPWRWNCTHTRLTAGPREHQLNASPSGLVAKGGVDHVDQVSRRELYPTDDISPRRLVERIEAASAPPPPASREPWTRDIEIGPCWVSSSSGPEGASATGTTVCASTAAPSRPRIEVAEIRYIPARER